MQLLHIRNWDRWQTYRSDRGTPPWIKIHRALLRNPEWVALTDAQRGQLVSLWMLAADRGGYIPADPALLRKLCFLDSEPDVEVLADKGFIDEWRQRDAMVTPRRRQGDSPEEEEEEEEDKEVDEERKSSCSRETALANPLSLEIETPAKPSGTKVIRALHDHFNQRRGGRPLQLDAKRKAKYQARLKTYSFDDLVRAINAALDDPFYRGDNDRRARYDFPEIVLKDDAAVDRHLSRLEPSHREITYAKKYKKQVAEEQEARENAATPEQIREQMSGLYAKMNVNKGKSDDDDDDDDL